MYRPIRCTAVRYMPEVHAHEIHACEKHVVEMLA
jgi:hypothetical protein